MYDNMNIINIWGVVILESYIILMVVCLLIITMCLTLLINQNKVKRKYMKKYNAKDVVPLTHVYGLDLSEWIPIACYIAKDKYIFVGDNREFIMTRKRIINKYLTTDIDIKKQAVSNVKGTVAGAMAFGTIGALLADNAKVVDVKTVKKLIIFEYETETGEVKTYAFDITNKITESTATYKFNLKKQKEVVL